jgi:acyl-CoA thioesterase-1
MKTSLKQLAVVLVTLILIAGLAALFFKAGSANADTIHVACVGDSITRDTQYPQILSTMLGANYTVANFGVGRTTVSLQFNKPYMNQSAFQNAQRFNPDIVVIMLGTNDAYLCQQERENFVDDYKALINSFQSLPSTPKIYIAIPPPVFNNTSGLPASVLDDEVIPLVKQTASDLTLPTIDLHTPLLDYPQCFPDGVHPDAAGSEVIATEIYDAIT